MRAHHGVRIRFLVRSAEIEQGVRAALSGITDMTLEVNRGTLADYVDRLTATQADALLLDLDLDDPQELLTLRQLTRGGAGRLPVIVTAANAGVDSLRQLMRLQITEYLPQPFEPREVLAALETALKQLRQQDSRSSSHATVFSCIKAAGGMGATSLAIQSAFELAGHGKKIDRPRTCLVDLDFQSGSVASYLDIEPRLNIGEIARAPHRLDTQLLDAIVSPHPGGFDVLAANGNRSVDVETVTPEAIRRLLDVTCEQYDHVVVDLPPSWTRWTANVLGGSDVVFVVLQLTVSSIRQTHQLLTRLKADDLSTVPTRLVLNRYRRSIWHKNLRVGEAERVLGRPIDHFVASDYRLVSEAHNQGVPLSKIRRRSRIEKQVRDIVRAGLAACKAEAAQPDPKIVRLKAVGK